MPKNRTARAVLGIAAFFLAGVSPPPGGSAAPRPAFGNRVFVEAVKRIRPSVVHIQVTPRRSGSGGLMDFFGQGPKKGSPFGLPPSGIHQNVGAGIVISEDGYILTNHHIVQNAESILVKLHTGEEFDATLSGVDEKSDLALLKVDAPDKLKAATLGDSDSVEVGEWVIAVGSPFGLSHSVSVGILSAKDRDLQQGPYDSYLQTDASINPGNSGGPLTNARGEVIGINTAIFSRGGIQKNMGVGFAVPINQAKAVIDDLRHRGYPIRGRLGVSVGRVPPDEGKKLGLPRLRGAKLAQVVRGGPAHKAGLRRGDVIVEFGGKTVVTWQSLPRIVARSKPKSDAEVKFYRDGALKELRVRLGSLPDRPKKSRKDFHPSLGMKIKAITPRLAKRFRLKTEEGLVIIRVKSGGPAERGGVRAGDLLLEVNHAPVATLSEFRKTLKLAEGDDSLLLLLRRRETDIFAAVRVR